jgi:hypothetical protein
MKCIEFIASTTTTTTTIEHQVETQQKNKENEEQEVCVSLGEGHVVKCTFDDLLSLQTSIEKGSPNFVTTYYQGPTEWDDVVLSEEAQMLIDCPNAGGNSEMSEAVSLDVLKTMFGADLIKTEMDIRYQWANTKKTDYSCMMFDTRLGVSVTRAMAFRRQFTEQDALHLLTKKLTGVNCSSRDVIIPDSWKKQLLHIWTKSHANAQVLKKVYDEQISDELKTNTTVVVTVTSAHWIFSNKTKANCEEGKYYLFF